MKVIILSSTIINENKQVEMIDAWLYTCHEKVQYWDLRLLSLRKVQLLLLEQDH